MQDFSNSRYLIKALEIPTTLKDTNDIFLAIIHKFKAFENKPNLLIIDDAKADLVLIHHHLPYQPHWHILVTSRQKID